jgi:hypothetical protein
MTEASLGEESIGFGAKENWILALAVAAVAQYSCMDLVD